MPEKIGLEAVLDMSNWNRGMSKYMGDIGRAERSTGGLGKALLGFGATAAGVAAGGVAALVGGMSAIAITGVKAATDFESQMAILSVAASGTDATLQQLKDTALAVGADTSLMGVNASQAADAMTGLYKAGLDTNDILGDMEGYLAGTTELSGALRAAVDLQAASSLDLAQASDLVAIAMNTFGLSAEDATRISDNFVQAADASVAEVEDLGAALKNIGPTAAQFGWSLEDTNNALAILSTRGISGSEAGTALKSMMTNLMRPTKQVTETLAELGVQLYNTDGTMRTMPEIINALSVGMEGLTEEQRNLAIQTIAGTYGMKAMGTLLDEGVVGWNNMAAATGAAASASEVAQARTNTFQGAMEALNGVIETLKIQIGDAFLPVLTDLIRQFGNFVADQGPAIAAVFGRIAEWIGTNLPIAISALAALWSGTLYPAIQQTIAFMQANVIPILQQVWQWLGENLPKALAFVNEHWEAFRAAIIAIGVVLAAAAIAATILAIVGAFSALLNPITLVIAAIGLLAAAWTEDWGGIRTFLTAFWKDTLDPFIKDVVQWFQTDLPAAIATVVEAWNQISEAVSGAFDDAKQAVQDFVDSVVGWFQDLFNKLVGHSIITDLISTIIKLFTGLPKAILGALADLSLGTIIDALKKGLVGAIEAVSKLFLDEIARWQTETTAWNDDLVLITEETLPNLENMFRRVSEYILEQLRLIIQTTEEWRQALEHITNTTIPALQTAFLNMATAVINALNQMIAKTNDWRNALEDVIKTIGELQRAWMDAFNDIISKTQELIDKLTGENGLTSAIKDTQDAMSSFVSEGISGLNDLIKKIQEAIEWFKRAIDRKQQLEKGGPAEMNDLADSVWNIANAARALATNLEGATLAMPTITMSQGAMPAMVTAGATTNNMSFNFNTTINSGMDQAIFEGRVRQTVRNAMRGY